jgi:tRNA(Ile)-lysidine synthase
MGPAPFSTDAAIAARLDDLLARCTFSSGDVTCAVSGGADSLALMALAVASGAAVHAIHVDHGLRPGSADEGDVVRTAAGLVGASFESIAVEVGTGPNLEARARRARYAALPDGVATGHTADDQAETMLLALLRGSAWRGLGAMAPSSTRPILALRRAETEGVCAALGWTPVIDPSNSDPVHRRNRVRAELLPLLTDIGDRDPVPVLVRQAELFRQGADVLAQVAAEVDPTDARAIAAAEPIVAREAIRTWLWGTCGTEHPPDLATVDRVRAVAELRAEGTDVGGGWRVTRSRQVLCLIDPRANDA